MTNVTQDPSPPVFSFVDNSNPIPKHWSVRYTNHYTHDFETGRKHARELTQALRDGAVQPVYLGQVVEDMPKNKGAVEHGFLTEIVGEITNNQPLPPKKHKPIRATISTWLIRLGLVWLGSLIYERDS